MSMTTQKPNRRWNRSKFDGEPKGDTSIDTLVESSARTPDDFTLEHKMLTSFGAGDSYLIPNFLSSPEADEALHNLSPLKLGGAGEVAWMQMFGANGKPFGRLKFTQAALENSLEPIYRYPTNNQASCKTQCWSPTLAWLRGRVEIATKQQMNHCVGNYYKDQTDFIGPHSDKMLDIARGSCIVSVSLGAERPIVLERMGNREDRQEISLPHGSLFVIGPRTNELWLHSIPSLREHCEHRISLTIRQMASFLEASTGKVVGQGSTVQTLNWPDWSHDTEIKPHVVHPSASHVVEELRASLQENGNHFDCIIRPCKDLEEAQCYQLQLRAEFPEACHVPMAWVFRKRCQPSQRHPLHASRGPRHGFQARQFSMTGSSSDGEPEIAARNLNTGRDGILEPLLQAGLVNCAVFVVRHWDGKRLGADRLVRVYAQVASAAMLQKGAISLTSKLLEPEIHNTHKIQDDLQQSFHAHADVQAASNAIDHHCATFADDAKEVRKLHKVLREIEVLEVQLAEGKDLHENQIQKIRRKHDIVNRLQAMAERNA